VAVKWPEGISGAAASCGIKPARALDLGAIVAAESCVWAGTFTHNAAAAAPVHWCRSLLGRKVRAIVVNSGNANACTGSDGESAVERTARAAAAAVGCEPEEILVASTGVIGIPLPIELIENALPSALSGLADDPEPFARSIMTTDTRVKTSAAEGGGATVFGVAKGAAMLAPNMATMLAFITTDAEVSQEQLQKALSDAVQSSFNRISVDACESTNDSVFVLATGQAGAPSDPNGFNSALTSVCRDLAHQMVRDAEGGSRVVHIQIEGARNERAAIELGRAVAASTLWRAAVHGADPNWGRVAAALGQSDRTLDLSKLEIAIGPETLFARGEPTGSVEAAKKAMDSSEFDVTCIVGSGPGEAEILTSDLSTRYVTENAWGTT
jgi:glutamate N-acetyltransferase/amino-acid N-acetyltransferase